MKKEVSTQTCLCKALSMNYTCLRIAGQDLKENNSLVYTRQDIFGSKTMKDVWLSKKLKDVADIEPEKIQSSFEPEDLIDF